MRQLEKQATELAGGALRKASALSISVAVVVVAIGLSLGDTIVKLYEVGSDVKRLQMAHDHCHSDMAFLKKQVAGLEAEIDTLRARIAKK
jgi:hypothetical protein